MPGNDSNTVLLCHYDSDLADSSVGHTSTHTPTAHGGAAISATQAKFGSDSLKLTAASAQYVDYGDSADFKPNGAFTIDMWVWLNSTASDMCAVSKPNGAFYTPYLFRCTSGTWLGYVSSTGSSFDVMNAGVIGTAAASSWHHLAISWDGAMYRTFLDGVLGATATSSTKPMQTTDLLVIGAYSTQYLDGFVDEVRFSNIARWTASFTPPTSAYDVSPPPPPGVFVSSDW